MSCDSYRSLEIWRIDAIKRIDSHRIFLSVGVKYHGPARQRGILITRERTTDNSLFVHLYIFSWEMQRSPLYMAKQRRAVTRTSLDIYSGILFSIRALSLVAARVKVPRNRIMKCSGVAFRADVYSPRILVTFYCWQVSAISGIGPRVNERHFIFPLGRNSASFFAQKNYSVFSGLRGKLIFVIFWNL